MAFSTLEDIAHVEKLKDVDSYAMWVFQIKILFQAKELMDVVDGTETLANQGEDAEKINKWKTRDARAQHYTVTTLAKHVVPHIITCKTAKKMFDVLKKMYPLSKNNVNVDLEVFCDSDYAGDVQDRKNTTGYVMMYAGAPVVWCSRKQSIVTLSSTEAEYFAAAECCKELQTVKAVITDLTEKPVSVSLNIDNQSAIKLIKSGQMSRKSRHIDVRYHYISVQFNEGLFSINYCPTHEQIADVLTKPLLSVKFEKFSSVMVTEVMCK